MAEAGTGAGDGAAGGGTGTGDNGGSGGPAKPWYDGIDAELIGHWDNKGWKKDDPKSVVIEATKQARELQKHFGVPENQLIKLPSKPDDEAGWKAVHERLGMPKEAKDYDLSGIKFKDGTALDAGFSDAMRGALHDARVAKDQASKIVKAVVDHMEGRDAADGAESEARKIEQQKSLRDNWKTNYEFNRLTAMQGARRLGIDAESLALMESQIGYAKMMEVLRKIGAGTTDDTFVDSGKGGHPTTQAGAAARKAELMNDPEWSKRYLNGDPAAKREMDNLITLIAGEAA